MDLQDILEKVKLFALEQGKKVVSSATELSVSVHADGVDITTNIDTEVEQNFYDFTKKHFPEFGFYGEEMKELRESKEYTWYIDPIDGTKWFKNNVPLWTMSFSLVKKGEFLPVLGVVYNAVSDQLYSAIKNEGAFVNGEKLNFNVEERVEKSQVVLDLSSHYEELGWSKYEDTVLDGVRDVNKNFYRVRNVGNGSLSLCWLAQSMFSQYINPFFHTSGFVDIAAGLLIAKESGATVSNISFGEDLSLVLVGVENQVEFTKKLFDY